MRLRQRILGRLSVAGSALVMLSVVVAVTPVTPASALPTDPGAISTIAGTGGFCPTPTSVCGDGGAATSALFNTPAWVAVSKLTAASGRVQVGDIFIGDSGDYRVRRIRAGIITTFAGTGNTCNNPQGACGDGGLATSASLNTVQGLALNAAGDLFVGDINKVRMVAASTGNISTVAGTGDPTTTCNTSGTAPYCGDGGTATGAKLNNLRGLAVDPAGRVYVADGGNWVVRRFTVGGTIDSYAGDYSSCNLRTPPVSPPDCGDNGPALSASVIYPTGLVFSGTDLIIAQASPARIRKVAQNGDGTPGNITAVAGLQNPIYSGPTGDGGPAISAGLAEPWGLALQSNGNLLIADQGGARVRMINTLGTITTVAGTGVGGFSGDGGRAIDAQIKRPIGIAVDASDNIIFADNFNYRAQKVVNAPLGYLQVVGSPSVLTQVSVDGVARDDWSMYPLFPSGPHTVCFTRDIEDFITPACQTVTVNPGATTTVTGTFVQRAFLQVGTSPSGLTDSVISVDGTPRDNITVYTDLPVGSHQVCWGPVADLAPPACQTVNLNPPGSTVTVIGNYTSSTGASGPPASDGFIRAVTSPAVPSQISVDGVIRDTWGTNWLRMAAGSHSVCYRNNIPGYTAPACQTVSVSSGATTTVTGTFTQNGYLHAGTNGLGDATISVDGIRRDNYDVYTELPVGSHELCFGGVAGKTAPACQTVNITAGTTVTVTGNYV